MPLYIIREDITKIVSDAIVNPTDTKLSGGGGLDLQIQQKGGKALSDAVNAIRGIGELSVGEARATVGGALPCRFVIHTVGPRYIDGTAGERELLLCAYRNALSCALSLGCESIALPLISTGTFAYPLRESFLIAREVALEFLDLHEISISLVIYQKEALAISRKIVEYVDDRLGSEDAPERVKPFATDAASTNDLIVREFRTFTNDTAERMQYCRRSIRDKSSHPFPTKGIRADADASGGERSLSERLDALDESFSEMLLRLIDERGMKDSECYKRANIDRKLFSKIRSDKGYRPSKPTVIAFALSLSLSLPETKKLLETAGFALSGASKFDVIIEYYIVHGIYDIIEINETLFHFDQPLIG